MDGLSNLFLEERESERERKSASAPPSNCSANYYAKIAEILATHDQLFWPTLYYNVQYPQLAFCRNICLITDFHCTRIRTPFVYYNLGFVTNTILKQ